VSRIIVALDVPTLAEADAIARSLVPEVGGFKVGMELLMAAGPAAIESIAGHGRPVFADAKLHDIPNTVERAATQIHGAGARWVTVHAGGGVEMIRAANSGMRGSGVLVVTALTSLSSADLPAIGIEATLQDHVARMTGLAAGSSAEGVVCSPAEIRTVREQGDHLTVFTPGVRPNTSTSDDQRRVATPEQAIRDGADYLVIGRPITRADDPVDSARKIAASIAPFH